MMVTSLNFSGGKICHLTSQQHIQRAVVVHKSLHGLAPKYLSSEFERRATACNLKDFENELKSRIIVCLPKPAKFLIHCRLLEK